MASTTGLCQLSGPGLGEAGLRPWVGKNAGGTELVSGSLPGLFI